MALTKIDHIAIAVHHLPEAISTYERLLNTVCYKIEELPEQGVVTAFFQVGAVKIELVSPLDSGHSLSRFLAKRGEGLHHIAFEVGDIHQELEELASRGFEKIGGGPTRGADDKYVQFLEPGGAQRVLVELCQSVKKSPI